MSSHDQANSVTADNPSGSFTLKVDRIATGGSSLGAGPDGRTVFVPDAIPGEEVEVDVAKAHKRRIDARLLDVVSASPDRVVPPCRTYHDGCGGCDWLHIAEERQSALRVDVVKDCLRRLARLPDVAVVNGPKLAASAYRTTVRAAVVDGRAGFRSRRSHDIVAVDACTISHPLIEQLLAEGYYGNADEVTIRVGDRTGESMVVISPRVADSVSVPDLSGGNPTVVVGAEELAEGRRPHIHETLEGIRLQVSAGSFFQCRPDGAEALASAVSDIIAPFEGVLLDAYAGVGLFGALCGLGRSVLAVESNESAAADARWNLRMHGTVFAERFEDWQPQPVGVAVADPARIGLQAAGVAALVACDPAAIALVSCDPASLARDAALLTAAGYELTKVTVFDLFGHTSHVETVSSFLKR